MPDLLIELFSEEIPARMQTRAAEDLKKLRDRWSGRGGSHLWFGAAALFDAAPPDPGGGRDMLAESPRTVREERKGPKADGAPDKAIEGLPARCGPGPRPAGRARHPPKAKDPISRKIEKPGRPAAEIIAEVLEDTIRNFPWPKSMRWGGGSLPEMGAAAAFDPVHPVG